MYDEQHIESQHKDPFKEVDDISIAGEIMNVIFNFFLNFTKFSI
jgi:hypothetical protein